MAWDATWRPFRGAGGFAALDDPTHPLTEDDPRYAAFAEADNASLDAEVRLDVESGGLHRDHDLTGLMTLLDGRPDREREIGAAAALRVDRNAYDEGEVF